MPLRFENSRILVTGAAQGIGQAVARAFTEQGARVWALDRDAAGLATALAVQRRALDLSQRAEVHRVVAEMAAAEGGVDVLVCCAGGVRGQVGRPLSEISEADWHVIFQANLESTLWCAQAAAPVMQKAGQGRIITIASGAGLRPSLTGIQAYTSAKHALVGLTKQLSFEFGRHGITANSVAPGFILSNPASQKQWDSYGPEGQARMVEGIHRRRLGKAEDIANAVLFFADPASDWVSGQILSVDGGRS
ncbi:SDR family NAD(P)-dependent oxidoreductase [Sediminicoccus sp. KRV36]|uniref:SDR family NAD(P)-dependent oxidoreductase n=1 Tax=Sediminicoccus sp. KRV36 TaxID=3133721 RepID=UPI00200F154E|nr:SDR family NAD(P)-dependent oxidoreductase [Sediminicoccus rosea]UPY39141.1 SDR family oxidoreductase [Sediminicoccus rosea]